MYSYTGNRSFQQGGIAAFLIVALVLAGLVGGGLSLVKWRTEQAALTKNASTTDTPQEQTPQDSTDQPQIADENSAPQEEQKPAEETEQKAEEERQSDEKPDETPVEQKPAEVAAPEAAPAPTPAPQVASDQTTEQPTVPASGSTAYDETGADADSTEVIVATGPAETFGAMLALGALTVGAMAYVQSSKRADR